MAEAGIKELLEAGVHFGHQTRRWNPRMRRYIHGERDGIHIIDLLQTQDAARERTATSPASWRAAAAPCSSSAPRSRPATRSRSGPTAAGMPYVNRRWLGGLLTNFNTISARITAPARADRASGTSDAGSIVSQRRAAGRIGAGAGPHVAEPGGVRRGHLATAAGMAGETHADGAGRTTTARRARRCWRPSINITPT